MDSVPTKTCTHCKAEKPLSHFAYRRQYGTWQSWCKVCANESSHAAQEHKAVVRRAQRQVERATLKAALIARTEKACSICGVVKPISAFNIQRQSADGRRTRCSECLKTLRGQRPLPAILQQEPDWVALYPDSRRKACTACRIEKPVEAFNKDAHTGDGLQFLCKRCRAEYLWDWETGRSRAKERKEQKWERLRIRFWKQVDKGDGSGCWLYRGAKDTKGYGRVYMFGKVTAAARVAYALHHGVEIPEHLDACHHCDNPPCVRPDHIFPGTHRENMADMRRKGRSNHQPVPENRRARGSRHGRAKLCEADVQVIRRLHAEGLTNRAIALKFHISPTAISLIVNRKKWQHVA